MIKETSFLAQYTKTNQATHMYAMYAYCELGYPKRLTCEVG
uniref:Uncharacterized protein n=1 Tax=Rhizophora mucronata TaxID=61149 RepID=A0A2P2ITT1_RHIMU